MVRLAIAGASVLQIAAVTGHALKDVEAIADAQCLGRDEQLAEAAVLKLEARTKPYQGSNLGPAPVVDTQAQEP